MRGCLLVLGLSAVVPMGCTVPYRPAQADVPDLPDDAFQRVVDVVRGGYPSLVVMDPEEFRIRTAWIPYQGNGQKRATVFMDPGNKVSVVVEKRFLRMDLFGSPEWTSAVGDPTLERDLLAALVDVLAQP